MQRYWASAERTTRETGFSGLFDNQITQVLKEFLCVWWSDWITSRSLPLLWYIWKIQIICYPQKVSENPVLKSQRRQAQRESGIVPGTILSRLLGEGLVRSQGWRGSLGKNREALKDEDTWQTVSQQMRQTGKGVRLRSTGIVFAMWDLDIQPKRPVSSLAPLPAGWMALNKSPYQPWFPHL